MRAQISLPLRKFFHHYEQLLRTIDVKCWRTKSKFAFHSFVQIAHLCLNESALSILISLLLRVPNVFRYRDMDFLKDRTIFRWNYARIIACMYVHTFINYRVHNCIDVTPLTMAIKFRNDGRNYRLMQRWSSIVIIVLVIERCSLIR